MIDAGRDNAGQGADEWETPNQEKTGCGGAGSRPHRSPDPIDARKLAEDWITLWQSEITAMAADPEMRETWQAVVALWAGTMSTMLRGLPRTADRHGFTHSNRHDRTGRPTRPANAPRAASAAASPDARDAEIERLARHVALLERRLAELERGGDPAVDPGRRPGRKPRK